MHNYPSIIKTARARLGLTQEQFADKLFLSRNYIAKLETGAKEPSVRVLKAIEFLVDSGKPDFSELITSKFHAAEETDKGISVEEKLKAMIRAMVEDLLLVAGNDPTRLSWIHEQMAMHLRVPTHWKPGDGPLRDKRLLAAVARGQARAHLDASHIKPHQKSG